MKKLLILALTSAFVAAANADNPNQFGVASTGLSNAEWKQNNQTVSRSYESGVISVDEEASVPLVLSPTTAFTAPDPQVKTVVTIEATFTAISDVDSLGSPGNDAKTALTVAKESDTNYYYYWNGTEWKALSGANPDTSSSVQVTITIDKSVVNTTNVIFKVDGTTLADAETSDTEIELDNVDDVGGLAFAGTGDLTSVAATVTPAYATTTTKRYASVSAALADSVAVNAITLHKHGDSFGTMPTGDSPLYFPIKVNDNDNTARLYSFTKVGDDYQIATAADLFALKDAVANVPAARSLSYKQTANIDMTGTDAFAGIGTYDANPTNGVPFTGTYDGGGYTISNVDFTQRNYGGIFNQVNGGTIKKLTVENITCEDFSTSVNDGEWGCAIVGNAGNGAILENLVANGSFGTISTPCTHNVAGIAIRLSEGNTRIINCTNNATLYGTYSKLGGICALTQYKIDTGAVKFEGCVNNGTITATKNDNSSKEPGVDGIAGIVAYTAGKTELKDCVNTGSFSPTYSSAAIGELVGKGGVETNGTLTDLGGNKGDATKKLVYNQSKVTGFKYATVDNGVATTVTSLAKDTTYLLEGNVAASETPVFTLAANGDTIAFDTALGYTFAGTVAAGISGRVNETSSSTVTTYAMQQSFTITWKRDADTTINTTDVYYGETPTHDDPTRVGYAFTGWDSEIVAATADATYTATWEQTSTPVVSTAETTLVAVPANCKADGLIDLSNRDAGDILKVYSKGDKCYYTWTLTGANGTWTPLQTWVINGEAAATSHSKTASEVDLSAGQAVWLTRQDTNKEIILAVVADAGTMKVDVSKEYNLIAPPPAATAYDAKTSLKVADEGSFDEGDQIVVPTTAAPQSYTRKDGKWKVLSGDATTPTNMPEGWGAVADPGWAEPKKIEIPSGQGFWFYSKTKKKLEF